MLPHPSSNIRTLTPASAVVVAVKLTLIEPKLWYVSY
jgi:hypothetical protein